MTEASVWLENHESETYSLYISLMCWNKHKIMMNTGCLLDMARHFEAEGVCGKQLQLENYLFILFCFSAYRQMTVLDWPFSAEVGSYRRLGADRNSGGGCAESRGSR